jgi:Ca2+-binding EF-hand superfamily protein
MKTLPFIVMVAISFAAGALWAEDPAPAQAEKSKLIGDTNGDGKLSREEFNEAVVNNTMKQLDTNGDGYISKDEVAAASKADAKDQEKESKDKITLSKPPVDQNKDGKISRDELKKAVQKDKSVETYFEQRDRDRDGFIQPYEATDTRTEVGVRFKF